MILQENNSTIGLFTIAVIWIVWRYWAFTIHPKRHPNSPKVIPYPFPWFGHILGFFRDGNGLITSSRLRYAPNREPFNISICGQNTYIITSAKDTSTVFRNITDLTFDAYVRDLLLSFGISKKSFDALWAKPSPEFVKARAAAHGFPNPNAKSLMHQAEDVLKAQLHPGGQLDILEKNLIHKIQEQITWSGIPDHVILKRNDDTEYVLSLKEWTKHCMLDTATRAFFGEAFLKQDPTILQTFDDFDNESWKFTYKLPQVFAQDVYTAKSNLQRAFSQYAKLPLQERDDACWLIKTLETEMRVLGTGDSDVGAYFLLLFWPLHGNPWKLTFWMISYILYQPTLRDRLMEELKPVLESNEPLSPTELCAKLDKYPLLNAIYNETLRLTSSTMTIRDVVNDCVIGSKLLRKGSRILIPYRQMFLDEDVFGPDAHSFNPDRFLNNPSLARDASFKPFGGGLTYCPGRFIARKEIFAMVATMMKNFKIELCNPHAPFPKLDEKKPGLGAMVPTVDSDVLVTVARK